MSHYKPYPAYKDSGVEWLGEVPEHWGVKSIKWLSSVQRGASPRPIDDPKYFDDDGEYAWVRITDVSASDGNLRETTQHLSELGSSLSVKIQPNELFVSIAGTVGKPCISGIKACIHDGFVYFPELKISPMYIYRIFEAGICFGGLGKLGTQLNLNTDTIGSIRIALPPSSEIGDVLSFLDRETAKIDTLISKQEKLIELLKEKRQAVISHAVTKGLNPKAKMKDSGVEWIGEVPEEWSIPTLKHLVATPITDGPHETPVKQDVGIKFISAESLSSGRINFSKAWGFISKEDNERFSRKYKPQRNDIYMIKSGATTGVVAIVEDDMEFNIWSPLAAIRPSSNTFPRFLLYALRSSEFQAGVALNWSYGTQQNIGMSVLEALPVPIPSLEKQRSISDYLDRETAKIDTLISKSEKAIELQKEHRTTLISAAVTGKIDVRGAT